MSSQIINNGGNRALVAYLYGENVELEAFDDAIFDAFGDVAVIDSELKETTIDTPRTVDVALASGDWKRGLIIGNCSGDLIVGVYFYYQPAPPPAPETIVETPEGLDDANIDDDPTEVLKEEPESAPSVPQLVCEALQEAFPDGRCGASAFVIDPTATEFELEIE